MVTRTRFLGKAVGLILAATSIGLMLFWALPRKARSATAPAALPAAARQDIRLGERQLAALQIAVLAAVPLPVAEPVNGRLAYDENATARVSSPVAGRVTRLYSEPGDQVRPGAALAQIDAPELAAAKADWHKAEADELRKRLAFERAQLLYAGDVLARKDWEGADADLRQAKAETARAALRMRNLHAQGNEQGSFALRSPLGGMVTERQLNPGQEVRADLPAPLFIVSDLRRLWLLVDVPERLAAALHAGQAAQLVTDAYPGVTFQAKVERIGMVLDPVTRRVQVRCAVNNTALQLKPEMFARVSFLPRDGDGRAVAVPNTSLFVDGKADAVFVETAPGSFVKRRVHLALRERDTSFADSGVAAGERIVTAGAFLLNAEVSAHAR